MSWELLDRPGEAPRKFSLSGDGAIALLEAAIAGAEKAGLPWVKEPIELKPSTGQGRSENLVELVRLSQLEATKEDSDAGGK